MRRNILFAAAVQLDESGVEIVDALVAGVEVCGWFPRRVCVTDPFNQVRLVLADAPFRENLLNLVVPSDVVRHLFRLLCSANADSAAVEALVDARFLHSDGDKLE